MTLEELPCASRYERLCRGKRKGYGFEHQISDDINRNEEVAQKLERARHGRLLHGNKTRGLT